MTAAENTIQGLTGWSIGYQYAMSKRKEDEIKQGGNHYIAGVIQSVEMANLGAIVNTLADRIPSAGLRMATKVLCNVVPLLSIPFNLFTATVKSGHYESFVEKWNESCCPQIFPNHLWSCLTPVLSFFADHMGDLIRVAMLAGSVALIAMGSAFMGGAILAGLAYEVIDTMGWVPRKISLFMETYMPIVSLVGLAIGGTALTAVMAVVMLPSYLFPSLSQFLAKKVDLLFRKCFSAEGPSLEEIEAPLVERKEMSLAEINDILDADYDDDFEINPAHTSKWVTDLSAFPEDTDLDKFITLFEGIDWTQAYQQIGCKLADDDRFIDFLIEHFPGVNRQEIIDNVEEHVIQLAQREGVAKEQYAADWLREQMVLLVEVLKGNVRVKGSQQDLDDAIRQSYKILPYLFSLQEQNKHTELEDALLKLAVEGGNYCARAIKRVTNELINALLQEGEPETGDDPLKAYEQRLRGALQDQRYLLLQRGYNQIIETLNLPDVIAQDVHAFDVFRNYLSLGVFPLSDYEKNEMGVSGMFAWRAYAPYRVQVYEIYQHHLDDAVTEIGEVHFSEYMQGVINTNSALSPTEKEALLEKFVDCNAGQWTIAETLHKFHRLVFVMLGVLRLNDTPLNEDEIALLRMAGLMDDASVS